MNSSDVLTVLKSREAELRRQGVRHAALFGSVARNRQRDGSDTDTILDLDPAVAASMFDNAGVKDFVATLFEGEVDVVDLAAMKSRVRLHALADAK